MSVKSLVIPADPTIPVRVEQQDGYNDLRAAVGGYVEAAPLDRGDISCYINEEGKLDGLPRNPRADAWWNRNTQQVGHLPGDYLVGTAVIRGFNPDDGEDTDVPDDVLAEFGLTPNHSNEEN